MVSLPPASEASTAAARPVRGRFAPSPTGRLHLGNLRTGVLAWLQARRAGGQFVLRMEDIDRARCRPEFAAAIYEDLRWLGLDWDEGPDIGGPHGPYTQSERLDFYRATLSAWQLKGDVFPCTCTRRDLEQAGAPHEGEEGPPYPGLCREEPSRPDQPAAWRFRVPADTTVNYVDQILGSREDTVDRQVGDFVVWRKDDWPSYQLAVVADDIAMEITDVVRGADLISSTARQILLFRSLGGRVPRWHHVPLWRDEEGDRLAKRSGGFLLPELQAQGWTRETVLAHIARSLGWKVADRISLAELLDPVFTLASHGSGRIA